MWPPRVQYGPHMALQPAIAAVLGAKAKLHQVGSLAIPHFPAGGLQDGRDIVRVVEIGWRPPEELVGCVAQHCPGGRRHGEVPDLQVVETDEVMTAFGYQARPPLGLRGR